MCGHATLLAALSTAAVLASSGGEASRRANTSDDLCFSGLTVAFDAPASIPGGRDPSLIELFLDGAPCIEIIPGDGACSMRAPPDSVCDVIAPLSIAEGWCRMRSDGSWSARFQVLSSKLLSDDVAHTLTAHISTAEGVWARNATVAVTRYTPWSPSGSTITCFDGSAEFSLPHSR